MAIGIALLGAGIFAREEHLPAIKSCPSLNLKAIYSRSEKSAKELASSAGSDVDVYFDGPSSGNQTLDTLLKRKDIQAVVIAIPITLQAPKIRQVILAGKHVLSEKPIAKDVETAKDLIQFHRSQNTERFWLVGENLRFFKSVDKAAKILKELDAELITFRTSIYLFVTDEDKYFQTPWRATPEYQGGFLLDGGIHFVAATRYLLAALNQEVKQVTAFTSLVNPKLFPVDTVHSLWQVSNGNSGSFNCSYGIEFKSGIEFEVVTSKGSVVVRPTEVVTTKKDSSGQKQEAKDEFVMSMGVKEEMEAFAKSMESGKPDERLTTAEALFDLQILEAMLKSDGKLVVP